MESHCLATCWVYRNMGLASLPLQTLMAEPRTMDIVRLNGHCAACTKIYWIPNTTKIAMFGGQSPIFRPICPGLPGSAQTPLWNRRTRFVRVWGRDSDASDFSKKKESEKTRRRHHETQSCSHIFPRVSLTCWWLSTHLLQNDFITESSVDHHPNLRVTIALPPRGPITLACSAAQPQVAMSWVVHPPFSKHQNYQIVSWFCCIMLI